MREYNEPLLAGDTAALVRARALRLASRCDVNADAVWEWGFIERVESDLATLTLAHEEHLDDVIAGYGTEVDRDLIRAWWSLRCLLAVRWLVENGFGPLAAMPEIAVLTSQP